MITHTVPNSSCSECRVLGFGMKGLGLSVCVFSVSLTVSGDGDTASRIFVQRMSLNLYRGLWLESVTYGRCGV